MDKHKVAIIGAGSIGALKPDKYDRPTGDNVLTHAHAIFNHPKMELTAIIDKDYDKAEEACKKWTRSLLDTIPVPYNKIDPLISSTNFKEIDIFIVSSPTETHFSVLKELIDYKPKLVIAEKPFCNSLWEAEQIRSLYEEAKIPIIINYTRRYDPMHQQIAEDIKSGKIGEIQNCRAIYGRGLMREASHMIDLFDWFFGGIFYQINLNKRTLQTPLTDYSNGDPTITACLNYKNCHWAFLTVADGRHFSIFEIDILGTKGRITLTEHGLICRTYRPIPEPVYGDYLMMNSKPECTRYSSLKRSLLYLLDNAVNHLEKGEPLKCSIDEAINVHRVIQYLK